MLHVDFRIVFYSYIGRILLLCSLQYHVRFALSADVLIHNVCNGLVYYVNKLSK